MKIDNDWLRELFQQEARLIAPAIGTMMPTCRRVFKGLLEGLSVQQIAKENGCTMDELHLLLDAIIVEMAGVATEKMERQP